MTTAALILIVDGDRHSRTLMSGVLKRVGYTTYEAETGEEALAVAKGERPALVVLEVLLQGVSGYQVCRELKDEFGEALPIVFVSGTRTEPGDRVAGLLVGGDDYLVKPFDPNELLARVRRLLPAPLADGRTARKLTRRELEVLSLLVDGLSQSEMAEKLFISPKTVGKHIEHILAKLGVHNRAQAVALAVRDELIENHRPSPPDVTASVFVREGRGPLGLGTGAGINPFADSIPLPLRPGGPANALLKKRSQEAFRSFPIAVPPRARKTAWIKGPAKRPEPGGTGRNGSI
jgi:two-component system, NarL family, nitrate/nitrite response regulator NarL